MATKEEITIEVVRGENPLAPPRGSATSEEAVDQFLQALEPPLAPDAAEDTLGEPLDLGFEHDDPTGLVEGLAGLHQLAEADPAESDPAEADPAESDPAPPAAEDSHARVRVSAVAMAMAQADADDKDPSEASANAEPEEAASAEPEPAPGRAKRESIKPDLKKRAPRNVQERIRGLTAAEQQKLARMGEQRERVVLERMYGKNVWESLLRNPKLTPPEAARIARMGALPLPLLELIVNNRAWLSSPQVRRALLSNPRLKKDMVSVVLRATPKNELKLMPKQMAYPVTVRQTAQKMLK